MRTAESDIPLVVLGSLLGEASVGQRVLLAAGSAVVGEPRTTVPGGDWIGPPIQAAREGVTVPNGQDGYFDASFLASLLPLTQEAYEPSSPEAVVSWPPPRGPRGPGGHWSWDLDTRPSETYVNEAEERAVDAHRSARCRPDHETQGTGPDPAPAQREDRLALSVLTGVEKGSAWPRFDTLGVMAAGLECRVQWLGDGYRRRASPSWTHTQSLGRFLENDLGLIASWQFLIVAELRHRMNARGQSKAAVARALRLRTNTVSEMFVFDPAFTFHGVRTLTAVAAHLDSRLEVVSFDRPWS